MNTTDPVDLEALRGFTEGEWATEPYCIYEDHAWLITSGTHHVAIAPDISRSPQKFANAALIAAAPSMHAELLARRARDAEVEALVARWRRYANDVIEEDATDEAVAGALNGCADELAALTGAKT